MRFLLKYVLPFLYECLNRRQFTSSRRCSCSVSQTNVSISESVPPNDNDVIDSSLPTTDSVSNFFGNETDTGSISVLLVQPFSTRSSQSTPIPHSPPPAYSRISHCSSISEALFLNGGNDISENSRILE